MTKLNELNQALKSAELSNINHKKYGIYGGIICDDKIDANLIMQAARKYANLLDLAPEIAKLVEICDKFDMCLMADKALKGYGSVNCTGAENRLKDAVFNARPTLKKIHENLTKWSVDVF